MGLVQYLEGAPSRARLVWALEKEAFVCFVCRKCGWCIRVRDVAPGWLMAQAGRRSDVERAHHLLWWAARPDAM